MLKRRKINIRMGTSILTLKGGRGEGRRERVVDFWAQKRKERSEEKRRGEKRIPIGWALF